MFLWRISDTFKAQTTFSSLYFLAYDQIWSKSLLPEKSTTVKFTFGIDGFEEDPFEKDLQETFKDFTQSSVTSAQLVVSAHEEQAEFRHTQWV